LQFPQVLLRFAEYDVASRVSTELNPLLNNQCKRRPRFALRRYSQEDANVCSRKWF